MTSQQTAPVKSAAAWDHKGISELAVTERVNRLLEILQKQGGEFVNEEVNNSSCQNELPESHRATSHGMPY